MPLRPRNPPTGHGFSALSLAWLVFCCASPSGPPASPAAEPSPKPPPVASAASSAEAGATTKGAIDRVIQDALAHVAEVRELAPQGDVKSAIISREELRRRIERDVVSDLEPEVIEGTSELLFALNLTRADFDYVGSLLLLFGTQLAGFYDPRQKEMVLLDDLGVEAQQATLWHELVHAIQDQNYGLRPLLKWSPDRGDAIAAVLALAEGDASSAMLDVMLLPRGERAIDASETLFLKAIGAIEALPEVASVPGILKRSVAAPYTDGILFTHALRRRGGWAAVDAAWRALPVSTEQLLHPDKYFAQEAPEPVELPPAPSGGPGDSFYHDVLGEQMVRLLFEDWVPLETARQAASGWAGDRVAVFRGGAARAMAVRLRYDDEPSAVRAFEVVARGALLAELEEPSRPRGEGRQRAQKLAKSGAFCEERARRGPFAAVRRGRDVSVTLGPYQRDTSGTRSAASCASAARWAAAVASTK